MSTGPNSLKVKGSCTPFPTLSPRGHGSASYKTQQRKNSAPKFLDHIGMNQKASRKPVQTSAEDIRKAFASRQSGILMCRVIQQHILDRKHPKHVGNWVMEREKAVNKIKQRGKERRKEKASRAASTEATGVYLALCINDLESGAII